MRIGLLTTSFPRTDTDIAGHFVLGFARTLASAGHHIDVLAPEPDQHTPAPSWPGIDVHFVPYLRPRVAQRTFYRAGVPDNLARDPLAWLGLLPFCTALSHAVVQHRERWDAVVSHFGLPCGLIASALGGGKRHLAVLHSADVHLLSRMPGRRAIARSIASGADDLLFVSAEHRLRFLDCLSPNRRAAIAMRCHIQPMGIEVPNDLVAARDALRCELGLSRFTLLTLARLVPVKGLAAAIQALAHRRDLEWLIAGDGPERDALCALAQRSALRVRLLGTVTGARKQALLRAADAFVLPSCVLASGRSEGVPTALLEAMASGLPVIASRVGGVGEVVRDFETGSLFDPGDPQALERAIDRLRQDPAHACALAARARNEATRHAWSAIAPRLQALIAESA